MLSRRGFILSSAAAVSMRGIPTLARIKPRWITEIVRGPGGALRVVERLVR